MLNNLILFFVLFFFSFGIFIGNLNLKSSINKEDINICDFKFSQHDFINLVTFIKKDKKYSNLDSKFLANLIKRDFFNNCNLLKFKYYSDSYIVKHQVFKNSSFYKDKNFSFDLYKKFLFNINISESSYQRFIIKNYKINLLKKKILLFNANNSIYFNFVINFQKFKFDLLKGCLINKNKDYELILLNVLNYLFILKVLKVCIFDFTTNVFLKVFINNQILKLNKKFFYKKYLIEVKYINFNKNFFYYNELKFMFKSNYFFKDLLKKKFYFSKNEINFILFDFLNRYKENNKIMIESFNKFHFFEVSSFNFIQIKKFFSFIDNKYRKKKSKNYLLQNFLNENYFLLNYDFFKFFFKINLNVISWPYVKDKNNFFFFFKNFNFGLKINNYHYYNFRLYSNLSFKNINLIYDDLFVYFKQIKMDSYFILNYMKNKSFHKCFVNKKFIYNKFVYNKLLFGKINRKENDYLIFI